MSYDHQPISACTCTTTTAAHFSECSTGRAVEREGEASVARALSEWPFGGGFGQWWLEEQADHWPARSER